MNLSAQQVRPCKFHRDFFRSFTGRIPVKAPMSHFRESVKIRFFLLGAGIASTRTARLPVPGSGTSM